MKVKSNIIIDGVIQHEDGGGATEVFFTDGSRGIPTSGLSETDITDTTRAFNNQQNFGQEVLTDATTLSWDLNTQQVALLSATGAVGNTRTLPNSILSAGVNGGNYQLTFVQDATGGRTISFDTSFNVLGDFDTQPNRRTLVCLVIQSGQADVILTPIVDPEVPQNLTGTALDISKYFGNVYNYDAFSNATTYTVTSQRVNGFARCFINAPSEPTVTGATKIAGGATFAPNTDMEMVVESPNGVAVEFYFLER